MKKLQQIGMFALLIAGLSLMSACQTAEGFGEDMEDAGESIQEGSN